MTEPPSPTYLDVVGALSKADIPVRELQGLGCVAMTPLAGRIVAMAFSREDANVLWTNPQLKDAALVKNRPEKLIGGIGGDRLWFAPEVDYHWNGPSRWDTFENYEVPSESDPGRYEFLEAGPDAVSMRARAKVTNRTTGKRLGFEVERTVRMTSPPLPLADMSMKEIRFVGIKTSHVLKLEAETSEGCIDLWHLLQVPAGSVLLVPFKKTATRRDKTPLSYGAKPGGWRAYADYLLWRYTGNALAKLGLSATASTGRAAVLRALAPNRWCLIVRQFPVDEGAMYGDHPYGQPRTDQVFQAWDGLGFGELEYHSPMLKAANGPRQLEESDYLWAFGGPPAAIKVLVTRLLNIEIVDNTDELVCR